MGHKIIFAPRAIADLERIVKAIAKNNPTAAERIGNALVDRVMMLEDFPLIGSSLPRRPNIRKLVSYPYIIYYRPRIDEGVIDILHYRHGAQKEPAFEL
jgi:toxin ParE1/3/4